MISVCNLRIDLFWYLSNPKIGCLSEPVVRKILQLCNRRSEFFIRMENLSQRLWTQYISTKVHELPRTTFQSLEHDFSIIFGTHARIDCFVHQPETSWLDMQKQTKATKITMTKKSAYKIRRGRQKSKNTITRREGDIIRCSRRVSISCTAYGTHTEHSDKIELCTFHIFPMLLFHLSTY